MLVDTQLQVVYCGEVEPQTPSAYVLVRVLAPLLGLERFPQGDGLPRRVPATHPDKAPHVGQYRGGNLARTHVRKPPRPACKPDEVPEVSPHDLGPKHAVFGGALAQRVFHKLLEVRWGPGRIPLRRMLGVPSPILAQNVPELGIIQERPYLGVVGALEV